MIDACDEFKDQQCMVPPTIGHADEEEILISTQCLRKQFPQTYNEMTKDKAVLMGCPTENIDTDYVEKIKTLIALKPDAKIKVAMTTKTCSKCIRDAVRQAVKESGNKIPVHYLIVDDFGKVMTKTEQEINDNETRDYSY